MATYRDTEYQNQQPGQWAPSTTSGAGAVGTILTGGGAPMTSQPVTGPLNAPPPDTRTLDPALVATGAQMADPFAGLTRTQVMAVQRLLGFSGRDVDGIVGPKTRAAYTAKYGHASATSILTQAAPASSPQPAAAGGTGGTGGSGYAGGAPATAAAAPPPSSQSVEDQIRQQYGYLASFLDIPEIGNVLRQAITEGWDQTRLQAAVQATQWWRTNSSSVRSWIALQAQDPKTAQDRVGTQMADIANQAAKLGVTITPDRLKQISEDSLKFGWDATQVQQAVAAEWHYQPGGQQGQLGVAELQIRQMASDYLVPLSDATLSNWEAQVARGTATPDMFRSYLIAQAKGMFPALATQLDAGMTVQQLAEPYKQTAAKELGVSPDSINMTDPKWSRPLTQVDPKTNTPTMMGLYDWSKTLRSDASYGWKYSQNANQMADDFELKFLQAIGSMQ